MAGSGGGGTPLHHLPTPHAPPAPRGPRPPPTRSSPLAVVALGKLGRSHSCFQLEPGRCWGRQTFRFTDEEVFMAPNPGPEFPTNSKQGGSHLVRVRAQVMMREDSTGGWVPLGGGGLSHVAVRKRKVHHEDDPPCKHEYLIYGKRINDQKVVMSCTIKKDFQYNRVMPTFHHWKTGNLKYGLTFQTAADARAFDKAVKIAVDDLLSGLSSPVSMTVGQLNKDVEEDDVFMQLELPLERDSSGSGDTSPTSPPSHHSPPHTSEIYPQFETHQKMNF